MAGYRTHANKGPGGYLFQELFSPGAYSSMPLFNQRSIFFLMHIYGSKTKILSIPNFLFDCDATNLANGIIQHNALLLALP